mgnify:FL=1
MDQGKIGKFIAKLRKEKGLTQKQLAEKLNVTDRAVSNWENGRRMPDLSLFKPLCETLEITINELILGEKVPEEKQKETSETVLLNTLKNSEQKQKRNNHLISILFTFCFIFLLILFITIVHFKEVYPKIDIYSMSVSLKEENNGEELEKKLTVNNQNIYYYGIDGVFVCNGENTCAELKQALGYKQIDLEKLEKYLNSEWQLNRTNKESFDDGGTSIYHTDEYSVILCNTLKGNKDVYIGNSSMVDELDGIYCGRKARKFETFARSYQILQTKMIDEETIELTVQNASGLTATIALSNTYEWLVGKSYEITFYTMETFEDTIENIFTHSNIYGIKELENIEEGKNESIIVNKQLTSTAELNEIEGVVMTIVDGTLTNKGATILITDYSGERYTYGLWYRIDQKIDGKWQEREYVVDDNVGWNMPAFYVDKNHELMMEEDWSWLYGELEKGEYRLVKSAFLDDLKHKYFSVEFEIK